MEAMDEYVVLGRTGGGSSGSYSAIMLGHAMHAELPCMQSYHACRATMHAELPCMQSYHACRATMHGYHAELSCMATLYGYHAEAAKVEARDSNELYAGTLVYPRPRTWRSSHRRWMTLCTRTTPTCR